MVKKEGGRAWLVMGEDGGKWEDDGRGEREERKLMKNRENPPQGIFPWDFCFTYSWEFHETLCGTLIVFLAPTSVNRHDGSLSDNCSREMY